MKTLIGFIAAGLLLTATLLVPATAQDPEPDVTRVVHQYSGRPVAEAECTRTEQEVLCSASVPEEVAFSIPSGLGAVDITATLTVDYGTTRGDGGRLIATLESSAGSNQRMRPGPFRLGQARAGTTTSVTWLLVDQQAGNDYVYAFEVAGAKGNDVPYRITVREAVLVLTATPG